MGRGEASRAPRNAASNLRLASSLLNESEGSIGGRFDMPDTDDNWPHDYSAKLRCHIHAIGVISLRFSQFEAALHDLFNRLASETNEDFDGVNQAFIKLNEEKRAKAIRKAAAEFERDISISAHVNNVMDYFEWCRECRNQILHSEQYPKGIGGKKDVLYLTKRRSKQSIDQVYGRLTVRKLRYIADRIERGIWLSAEIRIKITYGGLPLDKVPRAAREYILSPSLKKLRIPQTLTLEDHP